MQSIDFYNDYKYCSECDKYVTYLMSIHTSYCTECGGQVQLFSKEDWEEFNRAPASKRAVASKSNRKKQPKRSSLHFGRAQ